MSDQNYETSVGGLDEIVGELSYLDLVSGEDVAVGADVSIGLDEIIGALPAPHAQALRAKLMRARQVDRNAAAVVPRDTGPRRVKVLPVPPKLAIAAGAEDSVTIDAQELFRPERFVLSGSVATAFVIQDIKIATSSMLVADGDVPGEIFRPDAVGVGVHFKTINPGEKVLIRFKNVSAAPADFRGAFLGTSVTN